MAKNKPHPIVRAPAVVFVADCQRVVVINHHGIALRILDEQPKLERPAAEIIEEYVRSYKRELSPHLEQVSKLSRIALQLRRQEHQPQLP